MFKKCISIALTVSIFSTIFASFSPIPKKFGGASDLTAGAVLTASESQKSVQNLSDGNKSVWKTQQQGASIEIDFQKETLFNTVVLKEPSDTVRNFSIYVWNNNQYELLYQQDRIDEYRLCAVEDTTTTKLKLVFEAFDKTVKLEDIEIYYLKDYHRKDFRVTSYLNSALDESTGLTQVQRGESDPGYFNRFKVVTDAIMIGVVTLKADGTLEYNTGIDNFKKDVQILKKMNPAMQVRVTIMTGLVTEDFNANKKAMVAFAKDKLETYQQNLATFVEETGVDGIDYDWEYPQLPHEWSAYSKLIVASKEAIGGRDLSVALWPYGVKLSKEARACIDTVNMMTYDQFDKRGDHASIFEMGADAASYFLKLGFSKNQLNLGIPFYGRTSDKYGIWPSYDADYGKWTNYRENFKYTDADGAEQTSTVFLNGYAMVRDKTALALQMDFGGIMIFSSSADIDYQNEFALHKAVEEVLTQRGTKNT